MSRQLKYVKKLNQNSLILTTDALLKKLPAGAGILQDIPKMVTMTKEIVNATKLPVTVKTHLTGLLLKYYRVELLKDYKMWVLKQSLFTVEHESKCIKEKLIGL